VRLLVETPFIDLEAGNIQRVNQDQVAVIAGLLCCRTEPFAQSANSARSARCRAPTRARYLLGTARCAVFRPRSSTTVIAGSDSTRTQNRVPCGVPINDLTSHSRARWQDSRDHQQSKGVEVADINAVSRSQRDQDFAP
jgi:hypothetical protein